ncbi:MAG: hypothetical protein JNL58_11885 [Planctomyces sp.]|nr:hypothetical protein [Planctomyces sp.]
MSQQGIFTNSGFKKFSGFSKNANGLRREMWQLMRTTVSAFAVILVMVFVSTSQSMAGLVLYDFSTATGAQTSVSPILLTDDLTASSFTRGPGLVTQTASGAMNASGWSTGAVDPAADYFVFTIGPESGRRMSVTSMSFSERRSLTGPRRMELRSSLSGFSESITGTLFELPDNDFVRLHNFALPSEFLDLSVAVEFRLYGSAAEQTSGTWRVGNHEAAGGFLVDGYLSPPAAVPEPTFLASLPGAFGMLIFRRFLRSRMR